jgi:peptidyl-prolyl cis-trans isomerase C
LGQVTRGDLDALVLALPEGSRQPPAGESVAAWRRRLVEDRLVAEALRAEADGAGLLEDPAGERQLAARHDALVAEFVEARRLAAVPPPAEAELVAFYEAHPEDFRHAEQIRLRHIFKRVDRDAPAADRDRARAEIEALLAQVRDGANFDELARLHSDSETARYDGLIGRLDRGALDPALEEVVWRLDEGEVSEVVPTPVGFHVFKLDDRLEPFRMDFAEARGRLERRLTEDAQESARDAYFAELLAASGASWHPGLADAEAPGTVLFELGADRLTAGALRERLTALPFAQAREKSPAEHLEDWARQRLYLWEAERLGLAQEAALARGLAEAEGQVAVELAKQQRRRERLAAMGEGELEAFYRVREDRFRTAQLHHLRILVRTFPERQEAWYGVYEELDRLAEDVRAGREDFAAAARRLSEDFSRFDGGDVGWVRLDALAEWAGPTVNNRVAGLAVGEVSEPLLLERYQRERLRYDRVGYLLVRLEGLQTPQLLPFAEARESVVATLVARGDEELDRRVRQDVLAAIGAKVLDERL